MSSKYCRFRHNKLFLSSNGSTTSRTLKSDRTYDQKRRTLTTKSTNFYVSCHLCLSEYAVEHGLGLGHTQDLDVPCSSLSTKPYSESLVTYAEYEHGVKVWLEHGICARSIEYGFITSAPAPALGNSKRARSNIKTKSTLRKEYCLCTYPEKRTG